MFGLPEGDEDYTIALEAVSVDGEVSCKGSEPFDVEAGETTNVMVMLRCKLPQRFGGVRVNGEFNICAELIKAVVSPLQTSVGNDIDLSAQGVDSENNPISYTWTASGGSIADPNAASTTYTCQEIGDHEVNIGVTDNDDECDMAQWTIPITCVAAKETHSRWISVRTNPTGSHVCREASAVYAWGRRASRLLQIAPTPLMELSATVRSICPLEPVLAVSAPVRSFATSWIVRRPISARSLACASATRARTPTSLTALRAMTATRLPSRRSVSSAECITASEPFSDVVLPQVRVSPIPAGTTTVTLDGTLLVDSLGQPRGQI